MPNQPQPGPSRTMLVDAAGDPVDMERLGERLEVRKLKKVQYVF